MLHPWMVAIRCWFFRHLPFRWQMQWTQRHGNRITSPVRMSDPRSRRILTPSELSELDQPVSDTRIEALYRQSEQRRYTARLQTEHEGVA